LQIIPKAFRSENTYVWQGDFLFDKNSLSYDGSMYSYKPNTCIYELDKFDDEVTYERMHSARLGVVLHTAYEGKTFSTLQRVSKPLVRNCWNDCEDLLLYTKEDLSVVSDRIIGDKSPVYLLDTINKFDMDYLFGDQYVGDKEKKQQFNKQMIYEELPSKNIFDMTYNTLVYIKNMLIDDLSSSSYRLPLSYIDNQLSHEGFVVECNGIVAKLVNRQLFSRENTLRGKFKNVA